MEFDVVIVGAGLFGSIIAKALTIAGRSVMVFDDTRPDAGSLPAACLMKPSWLTSLGKPVSDASLAILDRLYGLQTVQFRAGPLRTKVFWVPPTAILNTASICASVLRLTKRDKGWWVYLRAGEQVSARMVVVAAGVWSSLLVPEVQQKGLAGIAFLWPGKQLDQPFIKVWAPYKQVVGFNRGDGVWVGDGSAILRQNWTEDHAGRSEKRCELGFDTKPKRLFGIRPYHVMKPCYLSQVKPNLWVATGGAKNGTLAAGWCAHEIVRLT